MSLTTGNAVIIFQIASILPTPTQLQQFEVDDIFDTEALNAAEEKMGADGFLSAGFVFEAVKQGYTLQADSPSNAIFDNWYQNEIQQIAKFVASATIILPAIGRKYDMTKGFLKSYKPISDGKKVLQARKHMVVWERASPSFI